MILVIGANLIKHRIGLVILSKDFTEMSIDQVNIKLLDVLVRRQINVSEHWTFKVK